MIDFIAYIYLLGAIILWGSYVVPFKKMKADVYYSQFLICSGIFTITVIISVLFNFSMKVSIFGLAAGSMWAVGNFLSLLAIKRIGISRAFPIWISSVLISYAWGIIVFSEITGFGILIGFTGTVFVVIGSLFVTKTKKSTEKSLKSGVILAAAVALLFGTAYVPLKLSGISAEGFYFQMSIGIFITSLIIFLIKRKVPADLQLKKGLLSGTMWGIANLFGIYVVGLFGIAKSGSLTQVCVVVGVLWGLLYFKEFSGKNDILRIIIGTLIILTGAFFVSFA